jgi:hypothetical protein
MQRQGDVSRFLRAQRTDAVFLVEFQRYAILQHLDTNPFANEAGFFVQQRMVSVVLVASVPEKGWILAYPDSLNPPLHCSSILKSFPRGGADAFQIAALDGAHIDIHIFAAQDGTGGRDHGDGVGAQVGFEDRVIAALPVVGGVLTCRQVPLPVTPRF